MGIFSSKSSKTWSVPEVIQTSAMDCGPASLKSILEGFKRPVSYGRLREACQTSVDGTSIDTLEEIACQLGLDAEQVVIPLDHLKFSLEKYPCIIVIALPNGQTHFVVMWKKRGNYVQIMNPGTGRHWIRYSEFIKDVYIHELFVPSDEWREWAESDDYQGAFQSRLKDLQVSSKRRIELCQNAFEEPSWLGMGTLDAAVRMTQDIVDSGGIKAGSEAFRLIQFLYDKAFEKPELADQKDIEPDDAPLFYGFFSIPEAYWSVLPSGLDENGDSQVLFKGCVQVRVLGSLPLGKDGLPVAAEEEEKKELSPELLAALENSDSSPGKQLWSFIRADGLLSPFVIFLGMFVTTIALLIDALVMKSFLELGTVLALPEQRITAGLLIIGFSAVLLVLSLPLELGMLRIGRHLEMRLRVAFLEKIPKLNDRYFQSRLTSDMAERNHSVIGIRGLPELVESWLMTNIELLLTAAGLIWLSPVNAWVIPGGILLLTIITYLFQSLLVESDLRLQTYSAALTSYYLNALQALVPIRAHHADRPIRREHEALQLEWFRAGKTIMLQGMMVSTGLFLLGYAFVGLLVWRHLEQGQEAASLLLVVFWALRIPQLSQSVASIVRSYPSQRNIALRLFEPLGAPEEEIPPFTPRQENQEKAGVSIELKQVDLQIAGHPILYKLDLNIEANEHVAIVGSSGAGKSSLVGLLLGWHKAASGQILIDGQDFDRGRLEQLRRESAWIDPQIHIWNRSLLDNLYYGLEADEFHPPGDALVNADLRSVLERLPEGLQTRLGEEGCLLSGGQGQRVRFGRALMHPNPRLVIMDEPFRGLDREKRKFLLGKARSAWAATTLLYISHDLQTTLDFKRVLVVEDGKIIEDALPQKLAEDKSSRFYQLLQAEHVVQHGLWQSSDWRRVHLENGGLHETQRASEKTEKGGPKS